MKDSLNNEAEQLHYQQNDKIQIRGLRQKHKCGSVNKSVYWFPVLSHC